MARDVVAEIRRATRRRFRAEEKIRIVLEGLRGEISVSQLCRRESISPALYYKWSKAFLEAGNLLGLRPGGETVFRKALGALHAT